MPFVDAQWVVGSSSGQHDQVMCRFVWATQTSAAGTVAPPFGAWPCEALESQEGWEHLSRSASVSYYCSLCVVYVRVSLFGCQVRQFHLSSRRHALDFHVWFVSCEVSEPPMLRQQSSLFILPFHAFLGSNCCCCCLCWSFELELERWATLSQFSWARAFA
jgi:hypothetical protein